MEKVTATLINTPIWRFIVADHKKKCPNVTRSILCFCLFDQWPRLRPLYEEHTSNYVTYIFYEGAKFRHSCFEYLKVCSSVVHYCLAQNACWKRCSVGVKLCAMQLRARPTEVTYILHNSDISILMVILEPSLYFSLLCFVHFQAREPNVSQKRSKRGAAIFALAKNALASDSTFPLYETPYWFPHWPVR